MAGVFFRRTGLHPPLSERRTRPFKFARATVRNDEHQKVAALGTFERQHLVPCGNRGDRSDDPFDIASDAFGLGIIHGVFLLLMLQHFRVALTCG
jgi:hypothetical protein